MRTKLIYGELMEARRYSEKLIAASKGEKSSCAVKDFEHIENYVRTWIIARIETALEELERCNK